MEDKKNSSGSSELRTRCITVAICLPVFVALACLGGWWLAVPIILLALLAANEYRLLCDAIAPADKAAWLALGFAYIVLGFLSLVAVRLLHTSCWAILWLLATIWITDSGAYFVGRRFGRTPLAPQISPHKTWEGAIGGAVAGMLIAGAILSIAFQKNYFLCVLLTLVVGSAGQVGDLVESKIKRLAGVKDSGRLLPGHGGALDRFDSLLLASPVAVILLLILL